MTPPYRAADFDYDCPPELIAQRPPAARGASRLMVLDRAAGSITHARFADFPDLLAAGDCLVRNTSRVMPARIRARRDNGRPAEVLLVREEPDGTWLAMVHPGGKLKAGRRLQAPAIEIVEVLGGGLRRVRFPDMSGHEAMRRFGSMPLPPYIARPADAADAERYQTVYAAEAGSVAAPTAGLHFTTGMLEAIAAAGVTVADVTLHVGPGTFKPVEVEDPAAHAMHAEWYAIPPATRDALARTRAGGGRVWAVGTTACRVLETGGGSGWTSLFIYPPYSFHVVDGLLTNFHLPRSTLLMLVAAFAGYDLTMRAYREAVARRYRLYSYGDAMAIR